MKTEMKIPQCCGQDMVPIHVGYNHETDGWFCYTCVKWVNISRRPCGCDKYEK